MVMALRWKRSEALKGPCGFESHFFREVNVNEFKRGVRFARAIQKATSDALDRPACSRTAVHMSETIGLDARCKMCGKRMEVEPIGDRHRLESGWALLQG